MKPIEFKIKKSPKELNILQIESSESSEFDDPNVISSIIESLDDCLCHRTMRNYEKRRKLLMKQKTQELVTNTDFWKIQMPEVIYEEKVRLFYFHSFIRYFEVDFKDTYYETKHDKFENKAERYIKNIEKKLKDPDFIFGGILEMLTFD